MLRRLEIQNYAIIANLDISFDQGLTIITGETGAGKSILLGALGLIMGKRADTKVLFDQEKKCFVEATFDIKDYNLHGIFEENELDYFDELSIRREIAPGGKSRSFINDSPVTLDLLQLITDNLINIHQQFDTLDIQKPSFQLSILDALADNHLLLEKYKSDFSTYTKDLKYLASLVEKNNNMQREMEFLEFQYKEFADADLKENEQEQLEQSLVILTSAEEIKKSNALLNYTLLENENSIVGSLQNLANIFHNIKNVNAENEAIFNRLNDIKEELKDIANESYRISEKTDYDELAISNTNERLNLIYKLQKKHNVNDLESLLTIQQDFQSKIDSFSDLSNQIASLEKKCADQRKLLIAQAQQLSSRRKNSVEFLTTETKKLLSLLSMEHAQLKVIVQDSDQLTTTGFDQVTMLFASNKGSEFLPLKDSASGGEMSRLTLCIKSLIAGAMTLPTIVFDEIDAGVSGDVANRMGQILGNLAKVHQLICITHSPQIASKADKHYWIYKHDTEQRTLTAVKELDSAEQVIEIAKMLSGNPPSDAAIANAKELLSS